MGKLTGGEFSGHRFENKETRFLKLLHKILKVRFKKMFLLAAIELNI